MQLASFDVQHVRVIEHIRCQPQPDVNIIIGPNGSGKTSLLEAIGMLSLGRSFRTTRLGDVIRRGNAFLQSTGMVDGPEQHQAVGVYRSRDRTEIKFGGAAVRSASALAQHVPMVIVGPEAHWLLEGGPGERRNLLDRTLFHVEHGYPETWKTYFRALKQRNVLLRNAAPERDLMFWDHELAIAGEQLHRHREVCTAQLARRLAASDLAALLGSIELDYRPGWDRARGLEETLTAGQRRDLAAGTTQSGPHRAEMRVLIDGAVAARVLSRGQSKLLASALLLAQAALVRAAGGVSPIVLIDDLAAELDVDKRSWLFALAQEIGGQIFATAIEETQMPAAALASGAVFHVKQGALLS